MRKALFALALMASVAATPAKALPSALASAQATVNQVWKELKDCGLQTADPYTLFLPQPPTPANLAILSPSGAVLAFYVEDYGALGVPRFVFKAPNGGQVHSVSFTRDHIQYTTPYLGNVAHVNRFYTPAGPAYRYYCRSQPVTPALYQACVKRLFVDVIVAQLCR